MYKKIVILIIYLIIVNDCARSIALINSDALRPASAITRLTPAGPKHEDLLSNRQEAEALLKNLRAKVDSKSCEAVFKFTMKLARLYLTSSDVEIKALLPEFLSNLVNVINSYQETLDHMIGGTIWSTMAQDRMERFYNFIRNDIYPALVEFFKTNEQALSVLKPIEDLMGRFGDKSKTRHHVDRNALSEPDFIEQYRKAIFDESRIELLKKRYPTEGVKIEVKTLSGFLMTKGVGVVQRVDDKHYIITLVGVPDAYKGYMILHEYLHIWHAERGLDFGCASEDADIARYAYLVKDLVGDYIVEKEIHRVFGDTFASYVGAIRDTHLIDHASGAVHSTGTIVLMLGITGKVTTSFYPQLRDSRSQRFIPTAIQWAGIDDAIVALQKISIRSTPDEFRQAASTIHYLLTDTMSYFDGDSMVVDEAATKRFIEKTNDVVGNAIRMVGARTGKKTETILEEQI